MLIILYFEKEVVTMINKEIHTNTKVGFNLVRFSSTSMCKALYYSPTLMKIIFS